MGRVQGNCICRRKTVVNQLNLVISFCLRFLEGREYCNIKTLVLMIQLAVCNLEEEDFLVLDEYLIELVDVWHLISSCIYNMVVRVSLEQSVLGCLLNQDMGFQTWKIDRFLSRQRMDTVSPVIIVV